MVRSTDRLDMTIVVDWDVEQQKNQSNKQETVHSQLLKSWQIVN